MPRKARIEAAGAVHHVTVRGNAGCRIVLDDDDRQTFLSGFARTAERYGWLVHAYCLMDTHLHAVVETPEPTLGAGMQRLLGRYAFEFNRRHDRFGRLFAGPFSSKLVETDAHAIEACAYVVLNPVRAKLVRLPEDWRWSSYRPTAGLIAAPSFLDSRVVPGMLHGERARAIGLYRELVRDVGERPRPRSS